MIEHNTGYHTTPSELYGEFLAMYQGKGDGLEKVFSLKPFNEYGPLMIIPANDGVVYITREQAKAFFGFSD
jgi:hypothetical protein